MAMPRAGTILAVTNSGHGSYAYVIGDAQNMYNITKSGKRYSHGHKLRYASHGYIIGDAEHMYDNAHGGDDILNGGDSDDILYGDAQSYAPSSPGSITGGKDTLNGGSGYDQLWGGPNNDKFKFDLASGNDVINDFNQGNLAVGSAAPEHDVIDVHAYGFANWTALQALISDDSSGNAVVHLSPNDSIALIGVDCTPS